MKRRSLMAAVAAGAVALAAGPALAQDVTLRLHQFLPPQAPLPAHVIKPWAESIEEASDGRIEIQHFDAMALGGTPPSLMDQARDGVVDISMTLTGYTPGRFPRSEVFELPFMMTSPVATSLAFWDLVESDLQESEFKDVHVLGAWVHGPGLVHSRDGVTSLEDMQGLKLRGPTRVINDLLAELGATPVGMPLPGIPEALSTGVIDATVIPWEVTPSIRLAELLDNHTEFGGDRALYTAAIVMVMNKRSYDNLPDDLKAIIDEQSGAKLSQLAAEVMWEYDAPGRKIAEDAGNTIVTLDEAEVARWQQAALPVVDRWVAEMDGKGIDGMALIDQAQGLIKKNETE
ncbi:TRAP transporter substrate-binding protein [Marinibacterium profundimaris]|uniref:C4-dicarboxylate ABC transporter n=1 Tax=Marinibacterium profundimaris TaxID=1679460 RepID=A0A225NGW8_9RHOB|nr:TRAP transporter substrate-binding protein [Marinibacterium profundimaris]OWU72924.1 C4-dicarboxylate ABC transporter [Marinibacterium profundimaris]